MKRVIYVLSLVMLAIAAQAQEQLYRVYFTDKGEQVSLLDQPELFLSGKAIWRRLKQNIAITESDLPVSKDYLNKLSSFGTLNKNKSKWLNYTVIASTPEMMEKASELAFIQRIERVEAVAVAFADAGCATTALNYGAASTQIEMVKGDVLHDFGFTGAGMIIAVLDGGFFNALPGNPGFDSLYTRGQVLGSYDFVQNDTDVFDIGSHGTLVLSVMGSYVENTMIGSAPDANYWLLKSENELNETTVEMDNWLRAAEFADSVGADVINSSLGYTTFDGGIGDLAQSDMDGNTALVTIAADMAAQKGILVVASAGNGGASSWPIIGAPADGDSVMAIGGVDGNADYVNFSSRGPSADGRIKPDVAGMARGTAFINANGIGQTGNGTSFSSPLIAGLSTCLWQSKPNLTNMEIYQAVIQSASHYYTPNNQVGYGIPNFEAASYSIGLEENRDDVVAFSFYPNPTTAHLKMSVNGVDQAVIAELSVYDLSGKKVLSKNVRISADEINQLPLPQEKGMYLYTISGKNIYHSQEIMVQ